MVLYPATATGRVDDERCDWRFGRVSRRRKWKLRFREWIRNAVVLVFTFND